MKALNIDHDLRKNMTHALVPIDNIICFDMAEDGDPETTKIHLATTDGIVFLNAKKWQTPDGTLQEYIEANS